MNRQKLLDLQSCRNEQGGEDGCHQEQKGDKTDEQIGSQIGDDGIQERRIVIRKSPDDVKGLLGLHKETGGTKQQEQDARQSEAEGRGQSSYLIDQLACHLWHLLAGQPLDLCHHITSQKSVLE